MEELEYDRDYWRQAVFYNIMLKENPQVSIGNKIIPIDIENKTIQTRYVFLGDTTNTSGYSVHDIEVTEEDIEKVKSQIKEFWDTVRAANFNSGCQKEDCDYCKLSKFVDFNLLK